ncbi:MAG: ABC transporter ATP-binding protein [Candidatus Binataceae bacterium]
MLEEPAGASCDAVDAGSAAAIEQVTFRYADGERPALDRVNLTLRRGEMIGIMGASGAGKSTLAKCLNRIVPGFEGGDFSGLVRIGGAALTDARVCDLASRVGMVFQDFESQLFSTNAAHEVAFAMEQLAMPREQIAARIGPSLAAVGLTGFEERDPASLSGGEKQRLAIAAVLALSPLIMVLDEPTTDLDPEGRAEVFALIRSMRAKGVSLLVIEHEAEELRRCDRIIVMRAGKIVAQGTPAQILTRLELLEQCGVHAPDLNRVLAGVGISAHADSVDQAERLIREAFPSLPPPGVSDTSDPAVPEAKERENRDLPLVEVRDVCFAYPHRSRTLMSVNLTVSRGDFLAIVGQNGSGKTTLAKQIVGLLTPNEGQILLSGRDRASLHAAEIAREAGYVFQNPDHQIFAATVEDEVAFGPRNFGLDKAEIERRCEQVLNAVNLTGLAKRDPFLLGKGERQRLAVASVMALRPRLLILDEPTTGLDYREQRRMMELVAQLNRDGIAIIIITHTPWLVAAYARRVVLMRHGRVLFDGGVRDFMERDQLLASSSFRPPEATLLGRRFGITALNPEEVTAWIKART